MREILKMIEEERRTADRSTSNDELFNAAMSMLSSDDPAEHERGAASLFVLAEEGYAGAECELGKLYETGDAVEQDYEKAAEYYTKAAEGGVVDAQYRAGLLSYYGRGAEQNYVQAAKWFQMAADRGSVEAQNYVGYMHFTGLGVKADLSEPPVWMESVARDDDNDPVCMGFRYITGTRAEQDFFKAAEWFKKGAGSGDIAAKNCLGYLYYAGIGVEQDYGRSAECFLSAGGDGGRIEADPQVALGRMCEMGCGMKRDFSEALRRYLLSHEQGNAYASFFAGIMYMLGRGAGQDLEKAEELLKLAAANRISLAELKLGNLYILRDENCTEASKWFMKAAMHGMEAAQYRLGSLYEKGEGVVQNDNMAVKWYTLAAKRGHKGAKARLAVINS